MNGEFLTDSGNGEVQSADTDGILALRKEIAELREEISLLPDRIVERLREELKLISTGRVRVAGYSTVAEVATKIQRSPARIRQAIYSGYLPGSYKFDKEWFIPDEAVEKFKPLGRGRPTQMPNS